MRSLTAPGMITLFVWSVLLTLFTLVAFVFASAGLTEWIFHNWITWVAGIGSAMLAWFLFPGIMPVIVNFFDVRIAGLIEKHDYPAATPLANPPFWPELWHDVRFSLFVILLNILLIPLYLVPVINIVVFYWLNGYVLGREFFIMTARRHIPIRDANTLWKSRSRSITLAGIALTVLATIPILNLVAPFWGIAVMTHLYHGAKATPKAELLPPK